MRFYSSESLWAIARLWYTLIGLIVLALLGNGLQHGFDELRDLVSKMHPVEWLIIAAACAPGPLAHWLARRMKQ
jgi:hypothetical protein